MKRFLLFSVLLLAVTALQAQIEEDFLQPPTGWVLSQGASFGTVTGNGVVVTSGVGGNNVAGSELHWLTKPLTLSRFVWMCMLMMPT